MPLKGFECPAFKLVNSDMRPRPVAHRRGDLSQRKVLAAPAMPSPGRHTVILTESDSNDSKITVHIPK